MSRQHTSFGAASTVGMMLLSSTLAHAAPASSVASAAGGGRPQSAQVDAVRPYHVNVPEEAVADLRNRLAHTRWPDKETVADRS